MFAKFKTMNSEEIAKIKNTKQGLIAALIAYVCYGLLPIYIKSVDAVPSIEVLAHRIIWSVPFGLLIVLGRKQIPEIKAAFTDIRIMGLLFITALLIGMNWYIYIYSVQTNQVLQASLGYYINPLFYVLVGVIFLKERLRALQAVAISIAAIGVLILTLSTGQFPWIAITLAASFTVYGVIRKNVAVGAMPGLFIETLIICPLALAYFYHITQGGFAIFANNDSSMIVLLLLAGPITVIPLLLFAVAARKLRLTTIGMMQFLSPTMQFIVALFYGEILSVPSMICFSCIWLAISIFIYDAVTKKDINSY
ncbi:MAG: chloramphenicol-sensitive protein RarD [Woeseiaceae bacterium]|jgi:chloramphenicol-sensitive protein RarD|tara:strand:+ start:74108 stop:75034 length:927 start_codon:yes stop_codon:yes gene_type:complete